MTEQIKQAIDAQKDRLRSEAEESVQDIDVDLFFDQVDEIVDSINYAPDDQQAELFQELYGFLTSIVAEDIAEIGDNLDDELGGLLEVVEGSYEDLGTTKARVEDANDKITDEQVVAYLENKGIDSGGVTRLMEADAQKFIDNQDYSKTMMSGEVIDGPKLVAFIRAIAIVQHLSLDGLTVGDCVKTALLLPENVSNLLYYNNEMFDYSDYEDGSVGKAWGEIAERMLENQHGPFHEAKWENLEMALWRGSPKAGSRYTFAKIDGCIYRSKFKAVGTAAESYKTFRKVEYWEGGRWNSLDW